MATFTIHRGDTRPALRYRFPAGVDLTGATVRFTVDGIVSRAPAQIVQAAPLAEAEYLWQPANTDQTGLRRAEFEVTYPGGGIETFTHTEGGTRLAVHVLDRVESVAVVRHIIGETVSEPLTLTDDTGAALDLTGMTLTALVTTPGGTLELPLTIHDPLIGEAWPAWGDLGLAPGTYSVRIRMVLPDGGVDLSDDALRLEVLA